MDAVDLIIEQWLHERPDLDPTGKAITGRIVRLANLMQRRFAEVFEQLGLSDGDYGLLAPLRRAGEPYELTPTTLARTRMITSGGLTPALDRLERRGWIERRPNPADRRGSLVRLTPAGLDLIDQAMELHAETELELVDSLSTKQRDQLAGALRELLLALQPD
jgi:DNA-binding MarR family transcriptional regulator